MVMQLCRWRKAVIKQPDLYFNAVKTEDNDCLKTKQKNKTKQNNEQPVNDFW